MGATSTKIGVVDDNGKVLDRAAVPTKGQTNINKFIDSIYDAAKKICAPHGGISSMEGIGVGAPNGNFYTGDIVNAANLPWKNQTVHFADLMSKKFNLRCLVTNDANTAAIGEMEYGAARGMNDFIMVTLGTGVGGGVVCGGKMVYGHDGFAGELGHLIVNRQDGRACGCGRKGCLETYCSATGVARSAKELLDTSKDKSLLRNLTTELTSKDVFDAAMQGDALAQKVFAFTGEILGEALADFIAFTSPEAIVLFGGLCEAGDLLMKPVKESMEKNVLSLWRGKVKLLRSQLPQSDAAIMGAASLIRNASRQ